LGFGHREVARREKGVLTEVEIDERAAEIRHRWEGA